MDPSQLDLSRVNWDGAASAGASGGAHRPMELDVLDEVGGHSSEVWGCHFLSVAAAPITYQRIHGYTCLSYLLPLYCPIYSAACSPAPPPAL